VTKNVRLPSGPEPCTPLRLCDPLLEHLGRHGLARIRVEQPVTPKVPVVRKRRT
jgi:hypothetical protein